MVSVGADIGGSHITCCLFDHGSKNLEVKSATQKKVDRFGTANEILSAWAGAISETIRKSERRIESIGLAMPGPFDYFNGVSLVKGVDRPIVFTSLVEQYTASVRRFGEAHPERLMTCNLDYEVSVIADRMMLKRAVSNVLENAHAYSRPGAPISMSVIQDPKAKAAKIHITDRGPGIAPEDLPHVSTPFFRADPSRSRNTGGIGLGLSLTRRILEAHRGSLRIRSSPEEGTTVTLVLPMPSDDDESP